MSYAVIYVERATGRIESVLARGMEYHHAVLRSQGGRDHPDDLLLLCDLHHHYVHNVDRAGAEECGLIRRVAALRTE